MSGFNLSKLAVTLFVFTSAGTYTSAQVPDTSSFPVNKAERLVQQAEAAAAGKHPRFCQETQPSFVTGGLSCFSEESLESIRRKLHELAAEINTHLKAYRNDVSVLILSARVGMFLSVWEPAKIIYMGGGGKVWTPPVTDELAPQHAALDRALGLAPDNAEVHYWKAQLYSVGQPMMRDGILIYARNLNEAIRFARRAVELAPNKVAFRESLAVLLASNQQTEEATAVIREVEGGRHPIYLLLSDFQSVPIPANAVSAPEEVMGVLGEFGGAEMAGGRIKDYPAVRQRGYLLPMSAADAEAFYRSRWPTFQFFLIESIALPGDGSVRLYVQHLKMQSGSLQPADTKANFPESPTDGFVLIVTEMRNLPKEARDRFPLGVGRRDAFCVFSIVNYRPLGSQ